MPKRFEPVYLRGGVWWCRVRNRAGRIVRKSTGCRDRASAILRWKELERASVDQDYAAAQEATFAQCVTDYDADMVRRGLSAAMLSFARTKLGHFSRLWRKGALSMADVGPELVEEFWDQRGREGAGAYTRKREVEQLSRVLTLARFHGKFHRPIEQVIHPWMFSAGTTPRTRAPTHDEFVALLAELAEYRAAHMAWIVATGGRRKESFVARREWVDWGAGVVWMNGTKTALAAGAVPITPISAVYLRWALDHAPNRGRYGPLFSPWGNIWRDVGAACVRAKIDHLSCNDLRRSFAKWHREALIEAGGSGRSAAEIVSNLLRHTTDRLVQTTYARLEAPAVGAAIRALLGPAKAAVPELYPSTSETAATEANVHDDDRHKLPEPYENAGAGQESRTPDLRLGKPNAIVASKRYEDRLSVGTRLGRERARNERDVLKVYRGALLGVLAARAAS